MSPLIHKSIPTNPFHIEARRRANSVQVGNSHEDRLMLTKLDILLERYMSTSLSVEEALQQQYFHDGRDHGSCLDKSHDILWSTTKIQKSTPQSNPTNPKAIYTKKHNMKLKHCYVTDNVVHSLMTKVFYCFDYKTWVFTNTFRHVISQSKEIDGWMDRYIIKYYWIVTFIRSHWSFAGETIILFFTKILFSCLPCFTSSSSHTIYVNSSPNSMVSQSAYTLTLSTHRTAPHYTQPAFVIKSDCLASRVKSIRFECISNLRLCNPNNQYL